MQTIRYLDREILFFLNHLGAEGPAREAVIRLLATGLLIDTAPCCGPKNSTTSIKPGSVFVDEVRGNPRVSKEYGN